MLCSTMIAAGFSNPEKLREVWDYHILFTDNEGVCWLGHNSEEESYFYSYQDTGWVFETKAPLRLGDACIDNEGTLYVMDGRGFVEFDGEDYTEYTLLPELFSESSEPYIIPGYESGVWIAGTLSKTKGWAILSYEEGKYSNLFINRFAEGSFLDFTKDARGNVWMSGQRSKGLFDYIELQNNDGKTWSKYYTLDAGKLGNYLQFAPDNEGGLWALWRKGDPYVVQVSHFDGEEWSESVGNEFAEVIAVDAKNNTWMFGPMKPSEDAEFDIYYAVNTGDGWSEPEALFPDTASDVLPQIAVDGEGRVWCAWSSERDGVPSVWITYTGLK